MGAWGTSAFDNDMACDWSYELENVNDLSWIDSTLDKVLAVGDNYLENSDAEEGIAAAETIARLRGNWGVQNSYTEAVDVWVRRVAIKPPPEIVDKAKLVIDRVRTAPSEALELWANSENLKDWHASLQDIKNRISKL